MFPRFMNPYFAPGYFGVQFGATGPTNAVWITCGGGSDGIGFVFTVGGE